MNIAVFLVPALGRLLLAAALSAGAALPAAVAAPYLPQNGQQVVETLPPRASSELQRLRAQLSATPRDVTLAVTLAQRYIAQGRADSDPRYFGYAQAALAPWWQQPTPPAAVRLLRATLLQNSHRFAPALADLDALTSADPGNAQAWLTRATVQTVRGDYAAALASCARLSTLTDQLSAITCLAGVRANSGQLAASERLLGVALERGSDGDKSVQVWALTLQAELAARRGDADQAERRYRQAMAWAPLDSYLLGSYADLLLDRGRHADVAVLLQPHRRIDSLLLRYALALQGQGGRGAELAAANAELQARFEAGRLRGDTVHQREQARFELLLRGRPQAALALAQQNWQVQKELADVRILLASAAGVGDVRAAQAALNWVRINRMEDVALAALVRQLEKMP
jgi:Tfp pilus assembly protein PilF